MNSDMEWYIVVWSIQVGRLNLLFLWVFIALDGVGEGERENIEDLVPRVTCEML